MAEESKYSAVFRLSLVMSIFPLPTLHVWTAERDVLPPAEAGFAEGEHID